MSKKDYIDTLNVIKASEDLKKETISKMHEALSNNDKRNFLSKLTIKRIIIAFSLFIVIFSTLAYANVIDLNKIYNLVFGNGSAYIQKYIKPINGISGLESSDDGIVIKLISAINDENSLRIFATATDTTGDRLSDASRIDEWSFSKGNGGGVSTIDYDESTKTVTFFITSIGENSKGKGSLQINGLSNRSFTENVKEDKINLYDLLQGHSTETLSQEEVFVNGGGGMQSEVEFKLYETTDVLSFGKENIPFESIDWTTITNFGFIDGCLHIQTKSSSENLNDLASINLIDKDANKTHNGHLLLYYKDIKYREPGAFNKLHDVYKEMIYPEITSIEQLKNLDITIDYMLEKDDIKGNWEFTFDVPEKSTLELEVSREVLINKNKVFLDNIYLSPMGLTLNLSQSIEMENYFENKDSISVEYEDATIIPLEHHLSQNYNGNTTITFSGDTIEIEKVKNIHINGEIIEVGNLISP